MAKAYICDGCDRLIRGEAESESYLPLRIITNASYKEQEHKVYIHRTLSLSPGPGQYPMDLCQSCWARIFRGIGGKPPQAIVDLRPGSPA